MKYAFSFWILSFLILNSQVENPEVSIEVLEEESVKIQEEVREEELVEIEELSQVVRDYPPLPVWSEEEKLLSKAGELSPNFFLLEDYRPGPDKIKEFEALDPIVLDELAEGESEVIPAGMIGKYFGARPEKYLNDPQGLLTQQELMDRLAFLDYHAGDSIVPVYLMIFDEHQIVPDGMHTEEILQSYFPANEPAVLAYYFLGSPERSQIAMSQAVLAAVSEGERIRLVRSCINEAVEKSDPIAQLERFSVQLSIRLFWIEKTMKANAEGKSEAQLVKVEKPITKSQELDNFTQRLLSSEARNAAILIMVLLAAVISAYYARIRKIRNQTYPLPEIEVTSRLNAEYAAGVGSVITFSSHVLPPSKQKEDLDLTPGVRRRGDRV